MVGRSIPRCLTSPWSRTGAAKQVYAKQTEAPIATLRQEREITDTVRAAAAQMRQANVAWRENRRAG